MAVSVAGLRQYLRIAHTLDDALLGDLLSAARAEAARYLAVDVASIPDEPDVDAAIYMLAQAHYEGAKPEDRLAMRRAAEVLLTPHRAGWGV